MTDSANRNLNAVLKESAERLLPLLGEQILLRSFCSNGALPIVQEKDVERILSRIFVQAREEMTAGGVVLLETTPSSTPHFIVSFRCGGIEVDVIRVDLPTQPTESKIPVASFAAAGTV